MTEGDRIMQVLKRMAESSDPREILQLHQELPERLSLAILMYGIVTALEAIGEDPELLNLGGAMKR